MSKHPCAAPPVAAAPSHRAPEGFRTRAGNIASSHKGAALKQQPPVVPNECVRAGPQAQLVLASLLGGPTHLVGELREASAQLAELCPVAAAARLMGRPSKGERRGCDRPASGRVGNRWTGPARWVDWRALELIVGGGHALAAVELLGQLARQLPILPSPPRPSD